jgi:DNA polymerase-3 subunit delta'
LKNPFLDPDSWQRQITSKNQQLQIPVKEIQNLQQKLSLTAAEGGNRVLIIWMPEQIKAAASNKLLKLIEEPLPNTFIILVSHRKNKLLPTIVSRCAPWSCKPLNESSFNQHFANSPGQTKRLLSMVFAPNLGAAITAYDDPESTQIDRFAEWMRTCYKGVPVEITSAVNELASLPKESVKTLILRSLHFLERGFYHNVQNTSTNATDLGEINVQKLSNAVVPKGAADITQSLSACLLDLERNIHVKTTLTHTSYALHSAFRGN